jgi:hypothetical protein
MFEHLLDEKIENFHSLAYSDEEIIQRIAYFRWLNAGCPNEKNLDFWLEAKKEFYKDK